MSTLLIIDDDIASCRTLQLHFRSQGFDTQLAHNIDDGLETARRTRPDLIILDIHMPGRTGLEGLPEFKQLLPDAPIIMITAFHDMDSTIKAMQLGASDYIHKPINIDELDNAIITSLMSASPADTDMELKDTVLLPDTMVGSSHEMKEIYKTIGMVAPKPVTVLITGESGTGKELVARAIHKASQSASGPFVAINCAALVESLLESDLFGHEKGAFTGATNRQAGKFALANNGTIFLDEIGELSPTVQSKLLRVLQEKEFIPVGGSQVLKTNARVIAATNVDLQKNVKNRLFREDLFYRLQVVSIHMPALRERMDDLPTLIQTLLARINKEMHSTVTRVSFEVVEAFYNYGWPGNIRELENVLMKAVALCHGETITLDLLPANIQKTEQAQTGQHETTSNLSLQDIEKQHIATILEITRWHRGKTCEILGISRPRLRRLIHQYELVNPLSNEKTCKADD
jgi:DNA-binding NtrC family response regulator